MRTPSVLALAASLSVVALPVAAQDISGNWSGFGKAKIASSGKMENFRCRVAYRRQSEKVFGVKAVCANPSTKIIQTGTVLKVRHNTFVGEFTNPDFDIRGRVRIVVAGAGSAAKQTVTLSATEGTGTLNLSRR